MPPFLNSTECWHLLFSADLSPKATENDDTKELVSRGWKPGNAALPTMPEGVCINQMSTHVVPLKSPSSSALTDRAPSRINRNLTDL